MNSSHRPELRAPAGSPEAAHAALRYGADAVYVGLSRFSARAEAVNFTPEQADSLIEYAHGLSPRRRVYVTLNTLVQHAELPGVIEALGLVSELGADAVIVQDIGVLRLARRHFPELRLHASTQMAIHNRPGVEMAAELGFSRVTLARELTLDEVRELSGVPGIEVETFVHGALCYSYSGLCLYSSFLLGRSGNRGRCAYLCRDRFRIGSAGEMGSGLLCSMKDLDLSGRVGDLRSAGVSALKIEGRMKSPLYVAATVHFYRRILDGTITAAEREAAERDIRSVFSRPSTELSVAGPAHTDLVDASHGGHRGVPMGKVSSVFKNGVGRMTIRFRADLGLERHDGLQIELPGMDKPFGFPVDSLRINNKNVYQAPPGSTVEVELPEDTPSLPSCFPVYRSSSQEVKRRYPVDGVASATRLRTRRKIRIDLTFGKERILAAGRIHAGASEIEVKAERDGRFEAASDPARMEAEARTAFGKLGNTRFELGAFKLENSDKVFVPVSLMNELRRDLVGRLETSWVSARAARLERVCAEACTSEAGTSKM